MATNWDRFDLMDDLPYFTVEERKRIDKVYDELQAKHDPIATARRKTGFYKFGRKTDLYDINKKVRDAEDAAGWPRSDTDR